jgi:DNA-binding PadR family transcriptional regulator
VRTFDRRIHHRYICCGYFIDETPMPDTHDLPLRPAVFHILLALSREDRHGLGIADEVEAVSEGAVRLGPGTLYRSLDEMRDDGLVAPTEAPSGDADPRRKYYRLTEPGRVLLDREVGRLERLVDLARARVATERT